MAILQTLISTIYSRKQSCNMIYFSRYIWTWEASFTVSSSQMDRRSISKPTKVTVAFALLSALKETRGVAGQIVDGSPQQCTCSEIPDSPVIPGRVEHRPTGTTSLISWSYSGWHFFFQTQGDTFWRRVGPQESSNNGNKGHSWIILPAIHRSNAE